MVPYTLHLTPYNVVRAVTVQFLLVHLLHHLKDKSGLLAIAVFVIVLLLVPQGPLVQASAPKL